MTRNKKFVRSFMKITYNKNKLIVLIVILAAIFLLNFLIDIKVSFAETSTMSTSVAGYVDLNSDNITGTIFGIRDYPDNLHATKAAIKRKDGEGLMGLYDLNEDDPIVNIVPKNHFFKEGYIIDIGDEYGYYINTTQNSRGNYLSTVLVFDVTTITDLIGYNDQVIVEVSPIFQYKFAGLTNASSYELFDGMSFSYGTLIQPCVVAYPSGLLPLKYEMVEEYYIKDVSFGASLYNEQALNYGDAEYNPYDDYGSYFTGFDYSYKGKYREYGEFDSDEIVWNHTDMFLAILGYCEKVPVIGKYIQGIGIIYDIVSTGKGWCDYYAMKDNALEGQVVIGEKKITATSLYQNRDDQLEYYRDDAGNPVLTKTAMIITDTYTEQSMWYGVGDNVTAYFSVGHSALNNRTPNFTRFSNQLALQIVSSENEQTVAAGSTVIHDSLRNPEIRELKSLNSNSVYMLPEGEDHFVFNDLNYESDYKVHINLSDNAMVNVNGESKYGKDLLFTVNALAKDNIEINLSGNEVGLKGSINISPNETTTIKSISANGKYIIKTNLSGIKNLQTNNSNLIIENILTYENNKYVTYESFVKFNEGSTVAYPFIGGQDYYIVIRNKSSEIINNSRIQISNIQNLVPERKVTVSINDKAMSFVNSYNTDMSYQLILPQKEGVNAVTIYNKNGTSISYATVLANGNIKCSFALSAGEECYLFFSLSTSVSFSVQVDEKYVKWEINGNIYNLNYNIALPRGGEHTVGLYYYKDGYRNKITTSYNIDNRSEYFTIANDVLKITYNVPYSYVITIVPINYPDATLRITPTEGREDIKHTIIFDKTGGSGGSNSVTAQYNRDMPSASKPSRTGYTFGGYYSSKDGYGIKYYDSNMLSVKKWDKDDGATLYAYWIKNTYTVTFNKNNGSGGTTSISVRYNEKMPDITIPTRQNYKFIGYFTATSGGVQYYGSLGNSLRDCDFSNNRTLYARWELQSWLVKVIVSHSNNQYQQMYEGVQVTYGQSKIYTVPTFSGYSFASWELYYGGGTIQTGTNKDVDLTNKHGPRYEDIYLMCSYNEACVASGTLITLADGSQKAVEELTGDEMLLVWNLKTGALDSAPVMFIDSDSIGNYEVIKLSFSDGTTVEVISEHGFWDVGLNKYIYLDINASKYIGHCFLKYDGSEAIEVMLIGVEINTEVTTAYSPVTYGHLCYFVNGMLSMPGGIEGLFNIFEVDEQTMTYDLQAMAADIEEYGLFTYEEFYEIYPISEEVFEAFNGEYLKVAIGKGLITYERIAELIERYSEFF